MKMNLSRKGPLIYVTYVITAVSLASCSPTVVTRSKGYDHGSSKALEAKAQEDATLRVLDEADGDFLGGNASLALTKYRLQKDQRAETRDSTLSLRVATCEQALGELDQALATLKQAEEQTSSESEAGLINSQIFLQGVRAGNKPIVEDSVRTEMIALKKQSSLAVKSGQDTVYTAQLGGPSITDDPRARAYINLGRKLTTTLQGTV